MFSQPVFRPAIVAVCLVAVAGLMMGALIAAQSDELPADDPNCNAEGLARQQAVFADLLQFDFEADPLRSRENLFRLGLLYQQLATNCGYIPSEQETDTLIQLTLSLTDVSTILAARSVGGDTQAILAELATLTADSFRGQLLYNGIEPGIDGSGLGCAGCHQGDAAPLTEGTWTRITEIRLQDPALAGYTVEQYLVESILHPNAYIPDGYAANLMPDNYGTRLDIQQLADLVAYLDSQDQFLDE